MQTHGRHIFSGWNAPQIFYHSAPPFTQYEGQCDCACSIESQKQQQDIVFSDKVAYVFPQSEFTMSRLGADFSMVTGALSPVTVLNDTALAVARHFQSPRTLADTPPQWKTLWGGRNLDEVYRRLVFSGLLQAEQSPVEAPSEVAGSQLSSWLHLTDRCNLRCAYCYLPHAHKDLTLETGKAALDAVFRSARIHRYSEVKVKYAGGEPLLCVEVLTALHQYARTKAELEGITLDGVVLSNGTLLTAAVLEQLQALNVRLMISLDGVGQFHNCQRHFAGKGPSFELVARAIEEALAMGLMPEISVTVSGRNSEGLPELFSWLLDHDLLFSVNFYRENVCSASERDLSLEDEQIISGMLAAYKVLEARLPRRSLLNSLLDRGYASAPHVRPCSAGQDYLVFNPDGRVAKCQMDLATIVTDCHDPDPITQIRRSSQGVQNVPVNGKPECAACQWRFWCAGGCPLLAYRATGRYDRKSPNCAIYRAIYPEVMYLEGLRLLRFSSKEVDTNNVP